MNSNPGYSMPGKMAEKSRMQNTLIQPLQTYTKEEVRSIIVLAVIVGNRRAGKAFNVPESTIRTWKKSFRDCPSWLDKRRPVKTPTKIHGTHRITVEDLDSSSSSAIPSPLGLQLEDLEPYTAGAIHALHLCSALCSSLSAEELAQWMVDASKKPPPSPASSTDGCSSAQGLGSRKRKNPFLKKVTNDDE